MGQGKGARGKNQSRGKSARQHGRKEMGGVKFPAHCESSGLCLLLDPTPIRLESCGLRAPFG